MRGRVACSGNPWLGDDLFSCAGEVEFVVIAVGRPAIAQPDAVVAACGKCAYGLSTWLQTVAEYDEGVMLTFVEWLRHADAPDLDNPRLVSA